MQKTINYNTSSSFSINLNGASFNNINQVFFIEENNILSLYIEELLGNNNRKYEIIPLTQINSLEVIT